VRDWDRRQQVIVMAIAVVLVVSLVVTAAFLLGSDVSDAVRDSWRSVADWVLDHT
jgi:hypothetical protein